MDETLKIPLRDIHLPDPVSGWPPAPGWWGLLILVGLLISVFMLIRKEKRRRRMRVMALSELEALSQAFSRTHDALALAKGLSVLLRRICLSYLPRAEVAALSGERWLDFLETGFGKVKLQGRFKEGPGRALISAPYRAKADIAVGEGQALLDLCGEWIRGLPPLDMGGRR